MPAFVSNSMLAASAEASCAQLKAIYLPSTACWTAIKIPMPSLDTPAPATAQPHPRVRILKRELLDLPFWGRAARHTGAVAVDRDGGGAALRSMVRDAKGVLDEGRPLVIFPEGTRSAPGEKVPYQPGVAALVISSGAPCYPVATNSGRHWGRRAFHKMPGVISISVLPSLPPGLARKPPM